VKPSENADNDPFKTRPTLIDKVRNLQNDEAWNEFVRIYRPLIVGFCISGRINPQDAEDIAQRTLAWVAERIEKYEYRGKDCPFRAWLFQKVRYLIKDHFRDAKREPACLAVELGFEVDSLATLQKIPDPNGLEWEKRWEEEHQRAVMRAASQIARRRLPYKYYQAFDMFNLQGLPAKLVAGKLGVTVRYVNVATLRFKEKLEIEVARLRKEYE
jgi:RNA polymerase sigma factor (sigma-70 family)